MMFDNANAPASPIKLNERIECGMTGNITINECDDYHAGLSKHEHFAGLAMQALLSDGIMSYAGCHDDNLAASVARDSIKFANALLAELDK